MLFWATRRGTFSNVTRYDRKHNTLRLKFNHVKLTNATRQILPKSMPNLATHHATLVFSLLCASKSLITTD